MGRFFFIAFLSLFLFSYPGDVCALPDVVINFDDLANAPTIFSDPTAVALRERYAPSGVHFLGPALLDGGVILKPTAFTGYDSGAKSPFNALMFNNSATIGNTAGIAAWPETIIFDSLWRTVDLWVTTGRDVTGSINGHYSLIAYDGTGNIVDSRINFLATGWTQVSVSSQEGIKKVEISRLESGPGLGFAIDDLGLTTRVPEPGTMLLLGLGLIGLGILFRRI